MKNHGNKYLLLVCLLALFESATYLSTDMYLPALPQLQHSLSLTAAQAQMTLSFWFIGSCALQLFFGPAADKWGRKPILLIGGVIFIIANFISAYTDSYYVLLATRFLQGCAV